MLIIQLPRRRMMNSPRQSQMEMKPEELRKYRRSKHESQGLFWARFGVTQSRGSRFEKGAEIPKPVAILLELYLNGVVTDGDLKAGRMLSMAGRGGWDIRSRL
jgi:hypothetical protein